MCPLVKDEFRTGGVSLTGGHPKVLLRVAIIATLDLAYSLFQVREFSKGVGMEDGSQGIAFGIARPFFMECVTIWKFEMIV